MVEQPKITGVVRIFAMIGLCLSSFIFVLDYTVANVAIPYIAGGLATAVEQGTYVITFFAVGNGVVLPMAGWLTKRFGLVVTLVTAVFWFTAFSVACGLAPDLNSLVLFRFLQGAAAGPLVPVSQAIMAMIYPKKQFNIVMAIFSLIVLVAPVFGPILGGYFCVYSNWRWIFLINLPVGLIVLPILWMTLKPLNIAHSDQKVDYVSFLLLLIGMFSLQLMLDKGEQWNWFGSVKIRICAIGTFFGLIYLGFWSFLRENPLINIRLLAIRKFLLSTLLIFVLYGTYMGTVVVIPIWLQTYMGYNAWVAGIAIAPMGIGALLTAPAVGRLIPRIGRIFPMVFGLTIMALSAYYTRLFSAHTSMFHIGFSRFILGLGIGLWVVPLMGFPILSLPDHEVPNGLGIFHFVRGVSGGIGTSAFTTIFQRRTIHQHENLVPYINPFSSISRQYTTAIEKYAITPEGTIAMRDTLIDMQAAVLAINEISMLMIYLFAICSILVLCLSDFKSEAISYQ